MSDTFLDAAPIGLGIDLGSVSVSCVLALPGGQVLRTAYLPHEGRPREALAAAVRELGPTEPVSISLTSSSPRLFPGAPAFDPQVCLIAAARRVFRRMGAILFVGGERFGLIRFDAGGNYLGTRSNSSCAAGTGSFLDQQARRLGLSNIAELAETALSNTMEPPRISTRCAVFARTDLVHAQQAGYTLGEICDGLCRGLAQNITDSLLGGEAPLAPVVFAGGVARNEAVRRHLEELFGVPVLTHELSPVLAAYGSCLRAFQAGGASRVVDARRIEDLMEPEDGRKQYFYEPLKGLSAPPRSAAVDRFDYSEGAHARLHPVEVEVYRSPVGEPAGLYLGIDIGSTSTKAILIDRGGEPRAGLYTRTSGTPTTAVQALCEAARLLSERDGVPFRFLGVAATGAGRKFVGSIVGADLVVDEITAHAKAAHALDPGIDTIIEIGGQDAKFTTMRDGRVTFSHMNTVCAAGTGSFLEEQAARLGCGLEEYAGRVRGVRAPLASDRCAVFMERDINNFLSQGFSRDEILAAALFSVRENYLQKVARGAVMGEKVCFQGATARNTALVAAFEEGLGRPIFVSPFCHLTGALGAALLVRDQGREQTGFRGLQTLVEAEIPIRGETCGLCTNHCRIRIATVAGETVAYGFLCGRDYDTARYVSNNRSGFDLAAERREAWPMEARAREAAAGDRERGERNAPGSLPVIGIPAALTLTETLPLWKRFFTLLSVPFVTSEKLPNGITLGKEVAAAEFCAPLTALHGHVRDLLGRTDCVFLPIFLNAEEEDRTLQRSYCYYTQYSSALASAIGGEETMARCLMPLVALRGSRGKTINELTRALRGAGFTSMTIPRVARAYTRALWFFAHGEARLRARFSEEMGETAGAAQRGGRGAGAGMPSVVLVGRPYTLFSAEMNKGIPQIFASLGVKTFAQDMIECSREEVREVAGLLRRFHWTYPARILKAAVKAARTPGLYPVFVTSFKCSPDSFAIEFFKRILDDRGKPYLILQLDDHDSSMGYETRIEAGVSAFRNHMEAAAAIQPSATVPSGPIRRGFDRVPGRTDLKGKTLFLPNFDPLVVPLMAANLRREGIQAWPLDESPVQIRTAMRHNTGQCIPMNIIAQDFMDSVRARGLDPARAVLWMAGSGLACNLPMFPAALEGILEAQGGGFERSEVYVGDLTHIEISLRAALNLYKTYLLGGLVRRAACRTRPYETESGATDRAVSRAMEMLVEAFEGKAGKDDAAARAAALFSAIPVVGGARPKAALFGDFYARDNDVLNQDLVRAIEEAGGEAVTTPYTDYVQIVADTYFKKWFHSRDYLTAAWVKTLFTAMKLLGRGYHRHFEGILGTRRSAPARDVEETLARFGLRTEHDGESFDNLLKLFHILREHPDLRLFVQTSPAFCCPALVTEAMARDIRRVTGVPVVSLTYDGTGQYRNDAIVPYLTFPRQEMQTVAARRWKTVSREGKSERGRSA